MSWILLFAAIFLETCGTLCLKLSQGFTRFWATLGVGVFYGLCFYFLSMAVKKIDLSVAYAIWSGVGTALIATLGVLVFKEPMTVSKCLFLGFIIIGALGLNLSSHP